MKIFSISFIVLLYASLAFAQWSDDPTVNTPVYTVANQYASEPNIVSDGQHGAIITWTSKGVCGQRLNAEGIKQWSSDGITLINKKSVLHSAFSDGFGGVVVAGKTVTSKFNGIDSLIVQRVNAYGNKKWGENGTVIRIAAKMSSQLITNDTHGGAIIAWFENRNNVGGIYIQRVDSTGKTLWNKDGVLIGTATYFSIVSDGTDGAIIAWRDSRTEHAGDIYALKIGGDGTLRWSSAGVLICSIGYTTQSTPAIANNGAGGAIIAWSDFRNGTTEDIYAQQINSNGEVQWTANGAAICTASNRQFVPSVISNGTDGSIIVWKDKRLSTSDVQMHVVFAQRLNNNGIAQWGTDGVLLCSIGTKLSAYDLAVTSDLKGGVFVATSYLDIKAQHVSYNGNLAWPVSGLGVCTNSGEQLTPAIVANGKGGAVVVWLDKRTFLTTHVYASHFVSTINSVEASQSPIEFTLSNNYPNPFNPRTTIRYTLPHENWVRLSVFNVLGHEVSTLIDGFVSAGYHEAIFDAGNLPSGFYVYKFQVGSIIQMKKMLLLK
jgi:hypothetical protein